jgi:superfamily II DNA or RNA helicase
MGDYIWQQKAAARFSQSKIAAIIAGCGTGKTRATIRIALLKMLPVIVIAPKNVTRQWRDEILEVAGENEKVWVYDMPLEHKDFNAYHKKFAAWLREGD